MVVVAGLRGRGAAGSVLDVRDTGDRVEGSVQTTTLRDRTLVRLATVVAATALLSGVAVAAAEADDAPSARGVDAACTDGAMEADQFADVHLGMVHSNTIDCLWVYGIVQGRFTDEGNVYDPAGTVTRQQMATYVVRMLDSIPDRFHALPELGDGPVPFADGDQVSSAHERGVRLLAELGIVSGYDDDTFRPGEPVNRAQMATFVAGAVEEVTGEQLPRGSGFADVSGVHQASVEKLAVLGVVEGRDDGTYGPSVATTRAQMASYVARTLDHLAEQGLVVAPSFQRGTATSLGLVDVEHGVQEFGERVTFTLAGDDAFAGFRVEYVEDAVQAGSGNVIDVAGDAVVLVTLIGMALPPDLDEELWGEGRLETGGELILEVVDGGVFEGRQQLFLGLSDLHDFGAARIDDPQRVYIDVQPTD